MLFRSIEGHFLKLNDVAKNYYSTSRSRIASNNFCFFKVAMEHLIFKSLE